MPPSPAGWTGSLVQILWPAGAAPGRCRAMDNSRHHLVNDVLRVARITAPVDRASNAESRFIVSAVGDGGIVCAERSLNDQRRTVRPWWHGSAGLLVKGIVLRTIFGQRSSLAMRVPGTSERAGLHDRRPWRFYIRREGEGLEHSAVLARGQASAAPEERTGESGILVSDPGADRLSGHVAGFEQALGRRCRPDGWCCRIPRPCSRERGVGVLVLSSGRASRGWRNRRRRS
jgi:hypothetical protein